MERDCNKKTVCTTYVIVNSDSSEFLLNFFLCWKRSFKRRGRTEKFDNFGLISFVVVVVVVIGGGGERKKWQAGNRGGGRPGYDPYAFFF